MNKVGKFYGLGIGPGDQELISVKAVRILRRAAVVIAPFSMRESVALRIAEPYILGEVLKLRFPMEHDKSVLDEAWDANTAVIKQLLNEGKDVAFITLGDPMVYSTYIYVLERLKGFEIETVPGITSFTAAAAKLNIPIAEGDQPFAVIPSFDEDMLRTTLDKFDNVVLMKVSSNFDKIVSLLAEKGFNAGFVNRCGQEGEIVSLTPEKFKGKQIDYLSLIIARRRKA